MARIRTIKPSFWSDEAVADLSRDARLVLLGLISGADDQGRFVATLQSVGGYIFPHDTIQPSRLRAWLNEIEATGIVEFYRVNKREYGHFPKWRDHQVINKARASTLPEPPHDGQVN